MRVAIAETGQARLLRPKYRFSRGYTPVFPTHRDGLKSVVSSQLVTLKRWVYKATSRQSTGCPSLKKITSNFCVIGGYTIHQYLATIEVAVLSGKLTAREVSNHLAFFPISKGFMLKLELSGV